MLRPSSRDGACLAMPSRYLTASLASHGAPRHLPVSHSASRPLPASPVSRGIATPSGEGDISAPARVAQLPRDDTISAPEPRQEEPRHASGARHASAARIAPRASSSLTPHTILLICYSYTTIILLTTVRYYFTTTTLLHYYYYTTTIFPLCTHSFTPSLAHFPPPAFTLL